jgi:hypothetical protein
MRKLEDIPKKHIFEVPEGYFEKLPGIIQSRVARPQRQTVLRYKTALQLAVPAFLIAMAVTFWINRHDQRASPENMLSSVETNDLIAYLEETDLTTEELLDHVELDAADVNQIEESVYDFGLNDTEIEDILNEIEQ